MKSLRISLAAGILILGLIGLMGCIWIPGSFKRVNSPDPRPETQIGAAGSDKPLWVGRATREKVIAVLGAPQVAANGGHTAIYQYTIETGGIFFICGFGMPTNAERYLRIDYDDQGVLRAFKVFQSQDGALGAKL